MSRRLAAASLALVAIGALGIPAQAATPARLHLAGHLQTGSGEPVTAVLPMTVRLYAASEGGDPLWSERHDAIEVAGGGFGLTLGGTTPLAPALLDRTTLLYAGVTVHGEDGDGEIMPRIVVGGVARALRVSVADAAQTLAEPATLAGPVADLLIADHGVAVRGASGADGADGESGADGVHCFAVVGDTDGDGDLSAADCRPPGPRGAAGTPGLPGVDCFAGVGDVDGDGQQTAADCRGPAGPPAPPHLPQGLLTPVGTEAHERFGDPLLVLPDGGMALDAIELAAVGEVVSVAVRLELAHPAPATLEVTLESPSRTEVLLHERGTEVAPSGWAGEGFVSAEPLAALQGEPGAGAWTLWVEDHEQDAAAGVLRGWALEVRVRSDSVVTVSGDLDAGGAVVADEGRFGSVRIGESELSLEIGALTSRLWCLEQCHPSRFDDCRTRTCDGAARSCVESEALPDDTPCDSGRGRCREGSCCAPATCRAAGGIRCGRHDDGCGGQLWCGGCDAGAWCGDEGLCVAR